MSDEPRKRTDYVFGAGDVPASEWHYSQPLFVIERDRNGRRVGLESYAERLAKSPQEALVESVPA